MSDELLTTAQVGQILGLHPKTVWAKTVRREIRAVKPGREYRYRREWVDEYLRSRTIEPVNAAQGGIIK